MASETCNTGFFFDVTLKLCLPCDPLCLGTAGQRHRGCSVCFASPTEAATTVQATTATSPTEQITGKHNGDSSLMLIVSLTVWWLFVMSDSASNNHDRIS